MSFWESVKAGFMGAAGVDYYSKQNRDILIDMREGRRVGPHHEFFPSEMSPSAYMQEFYPVALKMDQALAATRQTLIEATREPRTEQSQPMSRWAVLQLQAAADAAKAFFGVYSPSPLEVMRPMVGYEMQSETWGAMATKWLGDEDTDALAKAFLVANVRWTELDDELQRLAQRLR